MKMNKILIGLVAAGVLGAGLTVMASTNDGTYNKTVEVKPVNTVAGQSNYTVGNITSTDIEQYIVSKYGENWASDLAAKNGSNWDDILENELDKQYGIKYDDIIEDIIEAKEYELGLDFDNDHYDFDDDCDFDDHYDND